MKKRFLFVLIVLLVALTVSTSVSFAEQVSATPTNDNAEIENFIEELCALNAQHTGAGNNEQARDYIANKFREALGEATDVASTESKVQLRNFSYEGESYWNIVARLEKSDTQKQIIIGAHYDSIGGEGAADNVTGIAALYQTIKTLANADEIPFNITFVAFDGEELGLLGSHHFVEQLSADETLNTLVMFNIDSIALGDKLYLMCENKHTDLANTIISNSDGIVEKPYARGTYGSYLNNLIGFGYGYYEYIQGSDHTPFRLSGIPIAFIFSGTYSASPWGFSESSDASKQVINSEADTYENLSKYDFASRVTLVSGAIANTVLSESFATVAENARNQLVNLSIWYNKWWASLVIAVVLVILAVLAWLYNRKLQKSAILGTAEVKTHKVFDKPDASDIFTFDDGESKSDVDDIFTFKK